MEVVITKKGMVCHKGDGSGGYTTGERGWGERG